MLTHKSLVHQGRLPEFRQPFMPVYVAPQFVVPAREAVYVPAPAQEGMAFGTFLAGCTTAVSAAVMLDPKASKEAKAIAQMALGVSLPFVLNKAFEQQSWPQWN